jgi:transposase
MSQSRTLCIGMDVHKDAMAVAYVAQEHGAAVASLGPMGTRPGDSDQLIRKRPSNAPHLLVLSEAGPCGSWL